MAHRNQKLLRMALKKVDERTNVHNRRSPVESAASNVSSFNSSSVIAGRDLTPLVVLVDAV